MSSPHAMDFNADMVPIAKDLDDAVYTVAPAGSIWSNIDDMSKYVLMELQNS